MSYCISVTYIHPVNLLQDNGYDSGKRIHFNIIIHGNLNSTIQNNSIYDNKYKTNSL